MHDFYLIMQSYAKVLNAFACVKLISIRKKYWARVNYIYYFEILLDLVNFFLSNMRIFRIYLIKILKIFNYSTI